MNNKEYMALLAERLNVSPKDAQEKVDLVSRALSELLGDGDALTVGGLGTFEVKKKLERIMVAPGTKERRLIPPRLALQFRQSTTLRDKINS